MLDWSWLAQAMHAAPGWRRTCTGPCPSLPPSFLPTPGQAHYQNFLLQPFRPSLAMRKPCSRQVRTMFAKEEVSLGAMANMADIVVPLSAHHRPGSSLATRVLARRWDADSQGYQCIDFAAPGRR